MPLSSSNHVVKWTLALVALACIPHAFAQNAALETELPQGLSGDHLKVGSALILRIRSQWQRAECHFAPGTILHGKVLSVTRAPDGHTRSFTFTIEAQCGDKAPLPLVVTSLLAPPKIETVTESFPGFNSFGGGSSAGAGAGPPLNFNAGNTMRSAPLGFSSATVETNKLPASVSLGEVWRLPKIELVLPSGGSKLSTITSSRRSFQLPENTVFILQASTNDAHPLRTVSMDLTSSVRRSNPAIHPFITPCSAEHCTVLPSVHKPSGFGYERLDHDEDLGQFGFRPETDREVSELERSATVHFLGDQEVLITFPTHALIKRTGKEHPTDNPQAIRAVLFNLETQSVEHTEDWIVDDHKTYIWPVGHKLLVHDGQSLRVLGPGMKELAVLPLALPMESLQVSPDGEHIVIGEIHELHTLEDHELLLETDHQGPKEEVLWSLLDGQLNRLRSLGTSSNFVPAPTLLNDGMIELRKGHLPDWFLIERSWNSPDEKQLGSLRSSCIPALDNLSADLLAVSTCDTSGDDMDTFLLHENGSTVIDQKSDSNDLPIYFAASSASDKVALLLTRGSNAYERGLLFHLSVIQTQAVEIFDAKTRSLVAQVPIAQMAPYSAAFSLSPSGSTLALLSGNHLEFYTLKP